MAAPRGLTETRRSVAEHVRSRQRRVAEREASRLARPERRLDKEIGHADRKKSAVSTTPLGFFQTQNRNGEDCKKSNTQGATEGGWCGPFSVARQYIAEREEAKRKREAEQDEAISHPLDQVIDMYNKHEMQRAHPSLRWKGCIKTNVDSSVAVVSQQPSIYTKRQKRAEIHTKHLNVPSLFQLCVDFLANNFEYVQSLGDVSADVRTSIARALVAKDKMNSECLHTIAERGIETLEVLDCVKITQEDLCEVLKDLVIGGLRFLSLDQAGRCFGPKVVDTLVESAGNKSGLLALSVGGAYLWTDADAARVIRAMFPTLSSLCVKACPLVGMEFCRAISNCLVMPSGQLLELVLEDLSLSADHVDALVTEPNALKNLRNLAMRRIDGLDDTRVERLLEIAGPNLDGLDLTGCCKLTDDALSSIRRYCVNVKILRLNTLRNLTAPGLEALFTAVPDMSLPPMLRILDLGNCDYEAVTDQVIHQASYAATRKPDGSTMSLHGGLIIVDLQGSHLVTDTAMEYLAENCFSSLQEINVSFCPNVSNKGLGYLVEKCDDKLCKISVWGCAQLSDEFFDGNRRSNDASLEIDGAWIKKTSDYAGLF